MYSWGFLVLFKVEYEKVGRLRVFCDIVWDDETSKKH